MSLFSKNMFFYENKNRDLKRKAYIILFYNLFMKYFTDLELSVSDILIKYRAVQKYFTDNFITFSPA